MNMISTAWSCTCCGAAFISSPPDSGLCDDCAVVALREIIYGAARMVFTAAQSDRLCEMLADAMAFRSALTVGCPCCDGSPAEECGEHLPEWYRVQAYRQLARDLGEVHSHGS